MSPFLILPGIVIGAAVFGAFMWSFAQALLARGPLQKLHIALLACTLAGMATISLFLPVPAIFVGLALLGFGLRAVWADPKWSRLLPLAQAIFGVVLIFGLPFQGA